MSALRFVALLLARERRLAGLIDCGALVGVPTFKEAAELLVARVRAGDRVVLADADRSAAAMSVLQGAPGS